MINKFLNDKKIKFIFFVLFVLICGVLGFFIKFDLVAYQSFFQSFPLIISGIIFIFIYSVTTTLIWLGPRDILRIAAALLFGPLISTAFVSVAEIINTFILFHISRTMGQDFVVEKFKLEKRKLNTARTSKGFLTSLALRLNPLVPFRFQDIGAGVSTISFKKYFFAIILATPFRVFWLQYIIFGMGEKYLKQPSVAIDYFSQNPAIVFYSFLYFLSVLALSLVVFLARRKRK